MSKAPSPVAFTKREPIVKKCDCKHDFQDGKYGRGMRVMNPMKGDKYRCTVCRKERQ